MACDRVYDKVSHPSSRAGHPSAWFPPRQASSTRRASGKSAPAWWRPAGTPAARALTLAASAASRSTTTCGSGVRGPPCRVQKLHLNVCELSLLHHCIIRTAPRHGSQPASSAHAEFIAIKGRGVLYVKLETPGEPCEVTDKQARARRAAPARARGAAGAGADAHAPRRLLLLHAQPAAADRARAHGGGVPAVLYAVGAHLAQRVLVRSPPTPNPTRRTPCALLSFTLWALIWHSAYWCPPPPPPTLTL